MISDTAALSDLRLLIKSMKPTIRKGEYVFVTLPKSKADSLRKKALMEFAEREGSAMIVEKKVAVANALPYDSTWSLITLSVHSDLEAIGFLAKVTRKLAEHNIATNVVSAYHHDHIFVPKPKVERALALLKELQGS